MVTRMCYHGGYDDLVPRKVDHEERRDQIAEVALRVILRDGLDGVTVRGIAAEAGWSTGSLRHYFANQHELQSYVVRYATDTTRARVLPRVQRPRQVASPVEHVASIVEELLPLDAERREEYALWSAIVEWERRYPPPGGSRTWQDQRALYRQCIAALQAKETAGDPAQALRPHPDAQVEEWAAILHTVADGLAAQLIATPAEMTPESARALLRSLLRYADQHRG